MSDNIDTSPSEELSMNNTNVIFNAIVDSGVSVRDISAINRLLDTWVEHKYFKASEVDTVRNFLYTEVPGEAEDPNDPFVFTDNVTTPNYGEWRRESLLPNHMLVRPPLRLIPSIW